MITQNCFKYWIIAFLLSITISTNFSQNKKNNAEIQEKANSVIMIPTAGNSWFINQPMKNIRFITDNGIEDWQPSDDTIRTYFRTASSGTLRIGIRAKSENPGSTIVVSINNQETTIKVNNSQFSDILVGEFNISQPGYQHVDIISKPDSNHSYLDISHIIAAGKAVSDGLIYVKDDFYWGRRGPSVHLRYDVPEESAPVSYFYNEITVPEREDVLGSYFMANGFGQGYFGIQVNSETERRILFSVWSPFHTDNPEEIPEDMRIKLLKRGEGVHAGKFGNEGSGGQSYKKFMWKVGVTYGFLLKGEPTGNNSTQFTAWFFDPNTSKWALIASFERPGTDTYLTGLHSFLENFRTETGFKSRMARYSNQWMIDTNGNWHQITGATFSADATAQKKARLDYAGGSINGSFFMKNCGFFNEQVDIGTHFSREAAGIRPQINFDKLP